MKPFKPTHLLTITVGTRTDRTPVAVVDENWEPCEPGAGAQLVTAEEWAAEGSVSYALDADGALCCNGDAFGWGNGSWELVELGDAGREFPNALFRSVESARAGFVLLSEERDRSQASKRASGVPSYVRLLGTLKATTPDGRTGYCNRVVYAGLPEYLYGPGGTGDDRARLEAQGWTFEPDGPQAG